MQFDKGKPVFLCWPEKNNTKIRTTGDYRPKGGGAEPSKTEKIQKMSPQVQGKGEGGEQKTRHKEQL